VSSCDIESISGYNPLTPREQWAIVLAGVSDFFRPVENLSLQQNLALMATGAIWTRWCLIIKPRNVFLATVNFFLFCVGATQVSRVLIYRQSLKGTSSTEEVKDAGKEEAKTVQGVLEQSEGTVKQAVGAK
jgi:hypothetical protein